MTMLDLILDVLYIRHGYGGYIVRTFDGVGEARERFRSFYFIPCQRTNG